MAKSTVGVIPSHFMSSARGSVQGQTHEEAVEARAGYLMMASLLEATWDRLAAALQGMPEDQAKETEQFQIMNEIDEVLISLDCKRDAHLSKVIALGLNISFLQKCEEADLLKNVH